MKIKIYFLSTAIAWALPTFAATDPVRPSNMMSMVGVADTGDQVELRFQPSPSHQAQLIVLGNRSSSPVRAFPVTYEEAPTSLQQLGSPVVIIALPNGQKMTIACDPLSNLCHSDSYPSFDGLSFSISWSVTRAVASGSSKVRTESVSKSR